MLRFIFIILWLWFAAWSLPALIITLPVLAIGAVILALWPQAPPQGATYARFVAEREAAKRATPAAPTPEQQAAALDAELYGREY